MMTYILQVVCPHCERVQAIPHVPVTAQDSLLFVCTRTYGGCGRHALLHPPDLTLHPHVDEVTVTPEPLTRAQVKRLIRERGIPRPMPQSKYPHE